MIYFIILFYTLYFRRRRRRHRCRFRRLSVLSIQFSEHIFSFFLLLALLCAIQCVASVVLVASVPWNIGYARSLYFLIFVLQLFMGSIRARVFIWVFHVHCTSPYLRHIELKEEKKNEKLKKKSHQQSCERASWKKNAKCNANTKRITSKC